MTPLTGTAAASGIVGPFVPAPSGNPIWLTLGDGWTGTVQVMSSVDGGVTLVPLTMMPLTRAGNPFAIYSGETNEQVVSVPRNEVYFLMITLNAGSGPVSYRMDMGLV